MQRVSLTLSVVLILSSFLCGVVSQQNLRKGRGGRRGPKIMDAGQSNSFTVAYPMDILTDTGNHFEKDWRATAVKDQQLADLSDDGKPYAYLAKAQDQEDIWLYENWFYGMKGLIEFE